MREPRQNRVDPWGAVVAIELRGAWMGNRGILHRGVGEEAQIVRSHAGIAWIVCVLRRAEPAGPSMNSVGTGRRPTGKEGARWPDEVPFLGRRVPQWADGHYTPLFFHDEAVAFAAGHRPCAQCRRPAFRAFLDALAASGADDPGSTAGSPGSTDSPGSTAGSTDSTDSPGATGGPGHGRAVGSSAGPTRASELDRLLDGQRRFPRTSRRRRHERPWRDLPDGAFVVLDDVPAVVVGDAVVAWTTGGYGAAHARPRTGRADVLTPPATVAALTAGYPVQLDSTARTLAGQTRSSSADSSSPTWE